MKILAVTNIHPSLRNPTFGTFVEQQIKSLRDIGMQVEVMFVDRCREGMRAYRGLGRKVRGRLSRFDADLVHIMYGGVLADRITRAVSDRPTVVSFCGSDLLGENWTGWVRKMIAGYGVLASRRAARRASGIVVKSANLADRLPADVSGSKVRVIPNGVDLSRFKPLDRDFCRSKLGWAAGTIHVLFPANVGDRVKRPELARSAVDKLRTVGPKIELHELRGVAHREVPVWLNASDLLLVTSAHEGSPNVVKEALACQVPIVSVEVGDVKERIGGVEGCYLAQPAPADLAAKMALVLSGPGRIRNRDQIKELSLERVAQRLAVFYRELLALRRQERVNPEDVEQDTRARAAAR